MLLLGFASGLPLLLTASTLQAWLTTIGINLESIAWLGLASTPYALKFLWAPFLDQITVPYVGHRRGWILSCQFGIWLGLMGLSTCSPVTELPILSVLVLIIAFLSATQDIAIDAYRAEILSPAMRGLGTSLFVLGYRLGLFAAGTGALLLAAHSDWSTTYRLMALLVFIWMIMTYYGLPEPISPTACARKNNGHTASFSIFSILLTPIQSFLKRPDALSLLFLVVSYKLGDQLASTLTLPFLLRELNFSLVEIAYFNQGVGLAASIIGSLCGGILMLRWPLWQALFWFGTLQASSNLSFMLLALQGKDANLLALAVFFENLSGGMGSIALVALLMSLCDPRFTASQFALLSALAASSRFLSPMAGSLAAYYGWVHFFLITALLSLPALLLLWRWAFSDHYKK